MTIIDNIHQSLKTFHPTHCQIIDESKNHRKSSNEITHIRIEIVSEQFALLSLLERHKLVYQELKDYLPQLHAVSIHTYAPSEWKGYSPQSPQCRGGHKN